jgi:hypothetical protein
VIGKYVKSEKLSTVLYSYFAFQSINAYIYFTNKHSPFRSKEQALDKFVINGGKPLSGTVTVGGAKNASLALMP